MDFYFDAGAFNYKAEIYRQSSSAVSPTTELSPELAEQWPSPSGPAHLYTRGEYVFL